MLTKFKSSKKQYAKNKLKTNQKMSLQGKNVIITGATSGFGVQMAATLSEAGANVFIGGRRADKGMQVANDTKTTFHKVDVADETSNKEFFEAAKQHFAESTNNAVDYILLNAGVEGNNAETMVSNLNIETYDYIYSVNVRGVILGMQYGTPLLRKGGSFLVTSSAGSIMAFSGNPVYASSKAAVDSLVRSYAAQFNESTDEHINSLSIVAINPTLYATEMADRFVGGSEEAAHQFAKMVNPSLRLGKAEELALIVKSHFEGNLPYKNGDTFVADADTHFPLNEYFKRMEEASKSLEKSAETTSPAEQVQHAQ